MLALRDSALYLFRNNYIIILLTRIDNATTNALHVHVSIHAVYHALKAIARSKLSKVQPA